VTASCWFYTLFLFDTLGDAVGFQHAYWVLIVVPVMPLGLFGAIQIYKANQSSWCVSKVCRKSLFGVSGEATATKSTVVELPSLELELGNIPNLNNAPADSDFPQSLNWEVTSIMHGT
jgi:hypothetical protein